MSADTPIIELKDVEVTFTSRTGSLFKPNKVHAVRGVNMRIERGQTLGIVGESGCGKSTTANVMCGLQMPTKGQVFFAGEEVTKRSADARKRIGRVVSVVFQDPATALNPRMHVQDQLADPLRVHGIGDEASRAKRVRELIALVGLPSSALDALPGQLSGGQRQRVGVARALANRADILLMDEPFGALDPLVRADLQRELKEIQAALGTTILFVTHDVDEAFTLGDQVAVLSRGGRIEQVGAPSDLLSSPASEFVADFVGASRAARPVRLSGSGNLLIDEEGTPVGTLTPGSGGEGTAS